MGWWEPARGDAPLTRRERAADIALRIVSALLTCGLAWAIGRRLGWW